ncbi:hypothetical protein AQS8620_00201 [Aquimixticola soesokkakensis]|uniref:Rhodanese domain-containing protein n=1 Tax=Aquimixticola soesokkakensis TaxID=1519096 RepID=A0A1Y5RC34_9RHOB|nr:sulfurtransferase [Aquimixticola soesokkakensis]SLN13957.1 hypothetical protein AQS8620_00201 [Aquimixticola soesokkakensis]
MNKGASPVIGEVNPSDAWKILSEDADARLIDVRTSAEWGFVGVPDLTGLGHSLVCVEWAGFPGMSKNARFAAEVEEALAGHIPSKFLFLCRSGARSLSAAALVLDHFAQKGIEVECLNVAEGFEGDLDGQKHRGTTNGWKSRGLAWRQS